MGLGRDLVEGSLKGWSEHQFNEWSARLSEDAHLTGPGGLSGSGRQTQQAFYSIWMDGFPDNQIINSRIAEDGDMAVLEAVFEGKHTGVLHAPSGDIPPTGKRVSIPFVVTYTVGEAHLTSFRLYFDQMDLVSQLGLSST